MSHFRRRVCFCSFLEQFQKKLQKLHIDGSFRRLFKSIWPLGLSQISGEALTGMIHPCWAGYLQIRQSSSECYAFLYRNCDTSSLSTRRHSSSVVREVSATASGSIAGLLYPPASAAILIYTCPLSTQQLGVTPEIAQRERYTVVVMGSSKQIKRLYSIR